MRKLRPQVSLRGLALFLTMCSAGLWLLGSEPIRQRVLENRLRSLGAHVYYDWQDCTIGTRMSSIFPTHLYVEPTVDTPTGAFDQVRKQLTQRAQFVSVGSAVYADETVMLLRQMPHLKTLFVHADWQGQDNVLEEQLPGVTIQYSFQRKLGPCRFAEVNGERKLYGWLGD